MKLGILSECYQPFRGGSVGGICAKSGHPIEIKHYRAFSRRIGEPAAVTGLPYLREPDRCSRPRLCGYFLAIARGLRRLQRVKQLAGASGDRVDRTLECSLIAFRWFGCSAHLAHELKRGIMNLLVRRWRIKIEQGLNVSAHDLLPGAFATEGDEAYKNSRVRAICNGPAKPSHDGKLHTAKQGGFFTSV